MKDASTRRFGVVKREVGTAQHLVPGAPVFRRPRCPDTCPHVYDMAVDQVRTTYKLDEPRGELCDALLVDAVTQQDGKLIATQAGKRVRFAQAGPQPFTDQAQQSISRGLAQGVVHRLEAVEIEEEDGHVLIGTLVQPRQRQVEFVLKEGTVGHTGQLVEVQDRKHVALRIAG